MAPSNGANSGLTLGMMTPCRYKNYREQQRQLHDGWVERQKEREAKIARGEKVGPPERDPTEEREISLGDIVKFIVYVLLAITLGGKFITGDFMWGYRGKWTNIHTYLPVRSVAIFPFPSGHEFVCCFLPPRIQQPQISPCLPYSSFLWGGPESVFVYVIADAHVAVVGCCDHPVSKMP